MPTRTADFRLLTVAGRPYLVPASTSAGDGPSNFSPTDALDPYRTSATVLAETEAAAADGGGVCEADLHCSTREVPNVLVGALIGRSGETRARLQRDTSASLHIPPRETAGKERGRARGGDTTMVRMSAHSADALEAMETRVALVLDDARAKSRPTHFLSIPLNAHCAGRVETFVRQVCDAHAGTIPDLPSLVLSPAKFHVTLGTLKLLSAAEIGAARAALEGSAPALRAAVVDAPPVRISGLEIMNDDPSAADVVYAKLHVGGDALNRLCRAAGSALSAVGGFRADEQKTDTAGRLKAHATVINTRWRRRNNNSESGPLDARPILASHGDYDFGSAHLGEYLGDDLGGRGAAPAASLHLSRLEGAGGAAAYYRDDGIVPLGRPP